MDSTRIDTNMRTNGKRSFKIYPAWVASGTRGNHGYQTADDIESLITIQWICRRLKLWKTKRNVYDMVHTGGGINHREFPALTVTDHNDFEHIYTPFALLTYLMAKLTNPKPDDWQQFAKNMLWFRNVAEPITVKLRKPAGYMPHWLGHLHGVRLKKSPNTCHPKAWWLHGGCFHLNHNATGWVFRITYSYRHESSSWAISLAQKRGEKFEVFLNRLWVWLKPQIAWRHDDSWYDRFCVGHDGMKQNELKTCCEAELRMYQIKKDIRSVFAWGHHCPGMWEDDVGDRLIIDAHEQYRSVNLIQMTGKRLEILKRWISQDKRDSTISRKKQEQKKANNHL